MFGAKLWGVEIDIATEPVDEDAREIRILSVRMGDASLQKAGIYRSRVGFTYHMKRGRETAESYIALPVSAERFLELRSGAADENSEAYKEVQGALTNLAKLQGYDKLLGFHVEFKDGEEADDD